MGDASQPVTLTAGELAGDGFTVCWWSHTGQPTGSGAAVSTVLQLVPDVADATRTLNIGLGGEQLRVSYGGADRVAFEHGLTDPDDWTVPRHWYGRHSCALRG